MIFGTSWRIADEMITGLRPGHPHLVHSVEEMVTAHETEHRKDTTGVIEDVLVRHRMAGIGDIEPRAHEVARTMVMQIYLCPDERRGTFRMCRSWSWRRWIGEYKVLMQLILVAVVLMLLPPLETSFSMSKTLSATVVCELTSWFWAHEFP